MDPTASLGAGLIFAIFVVVAIIVLWRLRKYSAQRAEAEARMAAAMQELQLLAAKLQAQKRSSGGETAGSERSDATPST